MLRTNYKGAVEFFNKYGLEQPMALLKPSEKLNDGIYDAWGNEIGKIRKVLPAGKHVPEYEIEAVICVGRGKFVRV